MVVYLIGLSGSGKTTLGNKLKSYLDHVGRPCYLMDGDLIRQFFDGDLGYSAEERRAHIKRILLAAYVLSENNVTTIVCNIAPFEDLRQFARHKIPEYNQIYLKKDLEKCISEDAKGLYQRCKNKQPLVGYDLCFEPPLQNDLVLETQHESVEESFARLLAFLQAKYPETFTWA